MRIPARLQQWSGVGIVSCQNTDGLQIFVSQLKKMVQYGKYSIKVTLGFWSGSYGILQQQIIFSRRLVQFCCTTDCHRKSFMPTATTTPLRIDELVLATATHNFLLGSIKCSTFIFFTYGLTWSYLVRFYSSKAYHETSWCLLNSWYEYLLLKILNDS